MEALERIPSLPSLLAAAHRWTKTTNRPRPSAPTPDPRAESDAIGVAPLPFLLDARAIVRVIHGGGDLHILHRSRPKVIGVGHLCSIPRHRKPLLSYRQNPASLPVPHNAGQSGMGVGVDAARGPW